MGTQEKNPDQDRSTVQGGQPCSLETPTSLRMQGVNLLVSQGCCKAASQTMSFYTTKSDSLRVLGADVQGQGVSRAVLPLELWMEALAAPS